LISKLLKLSAPKFKKNILCTSLVLESDRPITLLTQVESDSSTEAPYKLGSRKWQMIGRS